MADKTLQLTDEDFLTIVGEESRQAVGFDSDDELAANREKALDYFKGDVGKDLPVLPNRSKANSTDFADAVETVLPDLMEIFTGGDDVATFRPQGEDDVQRAAQETDYVNHVVFNENPGWLTLYSAIKDALMLKVGIIKVWGEEGEEVSEELFENQTAVAIQILENEHAGEIADLIGTEPDPDTGAPLFNFTLRTVQPTGACKVMAVPPEDFSVARDAVVISKATYCAMRSRPRAQELIADGYAPDAVAELAPFVGDSEAIQIARDSAGEHADGDMGVNTTFNLHQVEVVEHYVRVDADGDGQPELWCVVTNADATVLLKKEQVSRIPFSVSTPFIVAHRLFGQSLFDKVREVQLLKTTLLRLMLDSGFFAMNQRSEVALDRANQFTLGDLLNNIPGAPIRSKTGDAVRPVGGGALTFDIFGAMEFASTMAEQRTGIVRNAQGLNPDTLHDTAKGAMLLAGAAQKRVRMIARVFAETGIKDLFLLVHDVCRTTVKASNRVELRGEWTDIDPSQWGSRNDMTIAVGVGSGGREQELVALNLVMGAQEKLVALQGGADGPFVTGENIYNTAKRLAERSGLQSADLYFSDPKKAPPKPPKPDPEMERAKAELDLERYKIDQEHALKREQMMLEMELKREEIALNAQAKAITGMAATRQRVEIGGEPG